MLGVELSWLDEVVAARDVRRLPVVLTPSEVRVLLHELGGTMSLVASLLYGTGMRRLEGRRGAPSALPEARVERQRRPT